MRILRRLYRASLLLLPRAVRARHQAELEETFDVMLSGADGAVGRTVMAVGAVADVVRRAAVVRWRRGGGRPGTGGMGLIPELHYAARAALRRPAVSLLVVLMVGLGVAASATVFTFVDGLLLRALPWDEPDRLVYVNETAPRWNLEYTGINYPDFVLWRENARAFESMALHDDGSFNVAAGDRVSRVDGAYVTHTYLDVLRLEPVLGRNFTVAEDAPGGPPVVAIGESFWQREFGGARDVIGRTLRINSVPHEIVAVFPSAAAYPVASDLWVPLAEDPSAHGQSYSYDGIARLAAGMTLESARADLLRAHEPTYALHDSERVVSPVLEPLRERHVGDLTTMMLALLGAALVVLLIASANVASVMLARAVLMQREVGVRVALGAGNARLAWQHFAESLVLAAAGAALGVLLATWGTRVLLTSIPEEAPPWLGFGLTPRVLGFVLIVTIGTTVLAGLAPVLQALRAQPTKALAGAGSTRTTASVKQRGLLRGIVVLEVALAAVLLVCGGLLLRAYDRLQSVDPGFHVENVLRFSVFIPDARYEGEAQTRFHEELLAELRLLPGVRSAGYVSCPPLGCHTGNFFTVEAGLERAPDAPDPVVLTVRTSGEYAAAVGMTMVRGSYLTNEQVETRDGTIVVNESFARQFWPAGTDVIGRGVRFRGAAEGAPWLRVVGVARDMRHYGLEQPARPTVFLPGTFRPSRGYTYVLHTSVEPTALVNAVRSTVRERDAELPVFNIETARKAMNASLSMRRTYSWVLAIAAIAALALALGGIHGVLSFVMSQRRQELGIRAALGARPQHVVQLVLSQGLTLTAFGAVLGMASAFAVARMLASILYGVSPADPLTYATVAAILAACALSALIVPARRAARVSQNVVLQG